MPCVRLEKRVSWPSAPRLYQWLLLPLSSCLMRQEKLPVHLKREVKPESVLFTSIPESQVGLARQSVITHGWWAPELCLSLQWLWFSKVCLCGPGGFSDSPLSPPPATHLIFVSWNHENSTLLSRGFVLGVLVCCPQIQHRTWAPRYGRPLGPQLELQWLTRGDSRTSREDRVSKRSPYIVRCSLKETQTVPATE